MVSFKTTLPNFVQALTLLVFLPFLPSLPPPQDAKSNIYNYKYTTSVEVVPICKDNVVCLPPKVAQSLGGIGQICVVHKVTTMLHLIDPNTCQCEWKREGRIRGAVKNLLPNTTLLPWGQM